MKVWRVSLFNNRQDPEPRPWTWLGILNFYVLQWFWIRLYKVVAEREAPAMWWGFHRVWPMSGYGNRPYRFW